MNIDIYQKIENDFSENLDQAIEQVEMLDARSKGLVSDRLLRAMVFLAKGNIGNFKNIIESGRTDSQRILREAEYGSSNK